MSSILEAILDPVRQPICIPIVFAPPACSGAQDLNVTEWLADAGTEETFNELVTEIETKCVGRTTHSLSPLQQHFARR